MTDGDVRAARLLTDGPATVEARARVPPRPRRRKAVGTLSHQGTAAHFPALTWPPSPQPSVVMSRSQRLQRSLPSRVVSATAGNCGCRIHGKSRRSSGGRLLRARARANRRPCLEVTRSLRASENTIMDAEREAFAEYKRELRRWKSKAQAARGEFPEPPPKGERLIVSDVTVEALIDRLFTSPAGLLLYRDGTGRERPPGCRLGNWLGATRSPTGRAPRRITL